MQIIQISKRLRSPRWCLSQPLQASALTLYRDGGPDISMNILSITSIFGRIVVTLSLYSKMISIRQCFAVNWQKLMKIVAHTLLVRHPHGHVITIWGPDIWANMLLIEKKIFGKIVVTTSLQSKMIFILQRFSIYGQYWRNKNMHIRDACRGDVRGDRASTKCERNRDVGPPTYVRAQSDPCRLIELIIY